LDWKSARAAIWLETTKGRFVLSHKEGPAFDDRSFDKYLNKRVVCDGFIIEYVMLVERIEILPDQKART